MRIPSHNPQIDFEVRPDSASDAYVIREQFCENVYDLRPTDLEDTKLVFDVGANIGAFSIYAALMADGVKVFAFEPEPDNFELLNTNCHVINKGKYGKSGISYYRYALSDHDGVAPLVQLHGNSHLLSAAESSPSLPAPSVVNVELITLNQALDLAKTEYVDVLKIDIEGHEYELLLANPELIARFRFITMEFTPDPRFGELLALLAETHNVKVTGRASQGGYIHARRY